MKKLTLILAGLLLPAFCFGATILEDNFNSYIDGDLNNQGSWVGDVNFDIQGIEIYEGNKAVSNNVGGGDIYKIGTQLDNGKIGVYMKIIGDYAVGDPYFMLRESTISKAYILFDVDAGYIRGWCWNEEGYVENKILTPFSQNVWYWVQIEWKSDPEQKVRYSVDEATTTAWLTPASNWLIGLDRVYLNMGDPTENNQVYWDFIAENPYELIEEFEYNILPVNSSLISNSLAYTGRLFTDLQNMIFMIIGLPIGFFSIRKVVGLIKLR